MLTRKRKLVDILRARGQQDRADWVERDLPDEFDTDRHRGLMDMLRVTEGDLVGIVDVAPTDPRGGKESAQPTDQVGG